MGFSCDYSSERKIVASMHHLEKPADHINHMGLFCDYSSESKIMAVAGMHHLEKRDNHITTWVFCVIAVVKVTSW